MTKPCGSGTLPHKSVYPFSRIGLDFGAETHFLRGHETNVFTTQFFSGSQCVIFSVD